MRYLYRPSHPKANERGFISAADAAEDDMRLAVDAPIMAGRFYENVSATDGTDIGSRAKHREYMKRNNLTIVSDYTDTWSAANREREAVRQGQHDKKERREQIERALYNHHK